MNRFSQVFVPSDYTSPFDLQTYGNVIRQREDEFRTNLQLLQSGVDQLSQTDILRDADRQNFNTKLAGLVNTVNQNADKDLSDPSVLGYLGSVTKSVYKDPTVISAMGETQKIRKLQSQVEEDRKKYKLAPQNEDEFNSAISSYLDPNDTSLGKKFDGRYDQYYNYSKKITDLLKNAKARGEIHVQDSDGLQTRIVKTKELTEAQLMDIVTGMVATDPQAARQMQIDANYKIRRLDDNGVATEYKNYAINKAATFQSQILAMQSEKERVIRAGNSAAGTNYDQYINAATAEMNRYKGLADPKNSSKLLDQIRQNKAGMYTEAFNGEFTRNMANLFIQKDESVSYNTNLKNSLDYKFAQARDLMRYKAVLKGEGSSKTVTPYVFNSPGTEESSIHVTESQLVNKQKEVELQRKTSKDYLKNSLVQRNPQLYGTQFDSTPQGVANFDKSYQDWRVLYDNGKIDQLPDGVADTFAQEDQLNQTQWMTETAIGKIDSELKKNPSFVDATMKLDNAKKNFPAAVVVKTGPEFGSPKAYTKDDIITFQGNLDKKNWEARTQKVIDAKGNAFDVKYVYFTSPDKTSQDINTQTQKNLAKLTADAINPTKDMGYNQMGTIGTLLGKGATALENAINGDDRNVIEKFATDYRILHPEDLRFGGKAGNVLDMVYNSTENSKVLNSQLTNYFQARNQIGIVSQSKDALFKKYGLTNMIGNIVIPNDDKTQDQVINIVNLALDRFGEKDASKKVKTITGVTRNPMTNDIAISYKLDNGDNRSVAIPDNLKGNLEKLYPTNPMQDVEVFLKEQANWSKADGTSPVGGYVTTPSDYAKAFIVPGTNMKVRYGYDPMSGMFTYAIAKGNGIWDREIKVPSLTQAVSAIQVAVATKKNQDALLDQQKLLQQQQSQQPTR
jgi:hypothetical protein